jgi:pyruvate ferredoxin oxidoreductase alpha subunit
LTGAQAAVEAMRQVDPDLVPVFPITPQVPIVEAYARLVADGRVAGEMVRVESGHAAMSAAIGASLAGARAMTMTASQGLAAMIGVVYLAASLRAPVVVAVGNRAVAGPINIHADHSDAMLARDSGAIQLFAESPQEVYDLMLMAPRLAEHPDVLLPCLVNQDAFTVTHSAEPVEVLADAEARAFVGPYRAVMPLLDVSRPLSHGPFAMPDSHFELRLEAAEAMARGRRAWSGIVDEYRALTGRDLQGVEAYRLDGAERVLVAMGSVAGTVKEAVDDLRAEGEMVGLLRIRSFRPFPHAALLAHLAQVPRVGVIDRSLAAGALPPLFVEVAATLAGHASVKSLVGGLGGRDIGQAEITAAYRGLRAAPEGLGSIYLGLDRGGLR